MRQSVLCPSQDHEVHPMPCCRAAVIRWRHGTWALHRPGSTGPNSPIMSGVCWLAAVAKARSMRAGMPARIDRAFATAASQQTPLMIGEFGPVDPGLCSAQVPWRHLITAARQQGIGWTSWSWDGHNTDCRINGASSPFNMVADGINLATLTPGWATEITVNDAASIRNTAQRTTWQMNGSCAAR